MPLAFAFKFSRIVYVYDTVVGIVGYIQDMKLHAFGLLLRFPEYFMFNIQWLARMVMYRS